MSHQQALLLSDRIPALPSVFKSGKQQHMLRADPYRVALLVCVVELGSPRLVWLYKLQVPIGGAIRL